MPSRCPMPSENFPARRSATAVEPDDVEHGVDPRRGDVVGLGQPAQVVPGAPARVEGLGVEQRAHLAQRPRQLA